VTGASYTGATEPVGPLEQRLAAIVWVAGGGVAGFIARSWTGLIGLWAGALVGSIVGIAGDPLSNILWLDLLVTVFGIAFFLTPGFAMGMAIQARTERLEPDGSGVRPTPPPLWSRGPSRPVEPPQPAQPPRPPRSHAPDR
jgi:hypothetical protein